MNGRLMVAAISLAVAGCAQDGGAGPSYIGLTDLTVGANPAQAKAGPDMAAPEALRHVQSNKVLGAMAFQKVTGRTVDPDSLSAEGLSAGRE